MYQGYDFYFKIGNDVIVLPITPAELNIKSGSNNKVVNLINEGDFNILKSPSLMEIEFEARFPMRQYPYARQFREFSYYFDKFATAKANRQPVRFSVVRAIPTGGTLAGTWGTGYPDSLLVSIEDLETNEDAGEGDDVIVSFKLKQYKELKVVTVKAPAKASETTSTSKNSRSSDGKGTNTETYTVEPGDCLWNIAKKFYGKGSLYNKIYVANQDIIEKTANKYRKGKGSSNGHWIYPGTKLTIPPK